MIKRCVRLLGAFVVVFGIGSLAAGPAGASAMGRRGAPTPQEGEGRRAVHPETGRLAFLGFDPGHSPEVASARAAGADYAEAGRAYLERYGPEFGLVDQAREMRLVQSGVQGRAHPRALFQQEYRGVPVLGGQLLVNMDKRGGLTSISGEVSPELTLDTAPRLSAAEAEQDALLVVAKYHAVEASALSVSPATLWIFDERLLLPGARPPELVWRTEVKSTEGEPIRELVLVNAMHGGISLHFNQIDTSWGVPAGQGADGRANPAQQETETPPETPTETPVPTLPPSDTPIPSEPPAPSETPIPTEVPSETPTESPSETLVPTETPVESPTSAPTESPVESPTASATPYPEAARPTEAAPLGGGSRDTYDANNGIGLPGSFVCDETDLDCTGGLDPHADAAHVHAADAYDFYDDHHGRDSLNDAGMTIVSTVHYASGYFNAFWSGTQMVYGDAAGFPLADDVVGHELTHGVTQYESNLFYHYQSGAINESFSDLWGEFIDLTNGTGSDGSGVRWLMGEDISGWGAIRDMENPPAFGDPDRMLSSLYYEGAADNGGVHTNSGVNNKAAFLLTDGGTFNGYTVRGLGIDKTAAIYYEAQTNLLTSGADYYDLYNVLYQACVNLIGGGEGITSSDCLEVRDATNAVEMNLQPATNFNPEAGVCPAGTTRHLTLFSDDIESGSGSFVFGALDGPVRWGLDSPYGPFAHSGEHFLYGDDYPQDVFPDHASDTFVAMASDESLPGAAFLRFSHAFGFEDPNWDGGVLEYSINSGGSWVDAGSLFVDGRGYVGTMFNSSGYLGGNPLGGRSGFIGDSHGYVSSRYNLSSLAGKDVRFRWRMGTDWVGFDWGWWLDDVEIYTCLGIPGVPSLLSPANGSLSTDYSPPLDWSDAAGAVDHYQVQVATDSGFNTLVVNDSTPTTSDFTPGTGLAANKTHWWRVRAYTAGGQYSLWSGARTFRTALLAPTLAAPPDGTVTANRRPVFDWSDVPGATSYTIQVSTNSLFTSFIVNASSGGSTFTPTSDLPLNKVLDWRVKANGVNGPSAWSAVRSILIVPP
jgi:Zn-dependent metalloprotease